MKMEYQAQGHMMVRTNQIKDRVVSHRIVGTLRDDIVSRDAKDLPGPGNYESPSRFGKGIGY